LPSGLNKS